MADGGYIHYPYHIWERSEDMEDQSQNWKKRKWWMILADFQRWYVALSTTETNQTVFDFLCKPTLQSIVFRAFLSWAWGHVYIFSATSVCLGFHSSLLSQQTVACKSSQLSVGSYIRSECFCIFQPVWLSQSAFLDVFLANIQLFPM